jgi:integrase
MAVDALRAHKKRQAGERLAAGAVWSDQDLVFSTRTGSALDAADVRRELREVCKAAGIGEHWTPRELRHSFVSLMSSSGVPVAEIARIAGHSSTRTTEVVYRRELRPILTTGAEAMDRLSTPVRPNLRGGAVVVADGDPAPNPCHEFHRAASISNTSRGRLVRQRSLERSS